jgi:hypothetical protein
MASRTRKSAALPVKRNATAYMSRIGWLPGALFLGAVFREERSQLSFVKRHEQNRDVAECLQGIRSDYERDGFKEMLWADCLEMGFEPSEIREFETNPAAITSCLYVGQGMKPPVNIAKLNVRLP